jgi:TolB-like protein/DNA-binding response OmpR family regulator/tetratricopeptide (TPR) repeat protein
VRHPVLVVAREATARANLTRLLTSNGYEVEVAESTKRAFERIATANFAAAVVAPDRLGGGYEQLVQSLSQITGGVVLLSETQGENDARRRPFVTVALAGTPPENSNLLTEIERAVNAKTRPQAGIWLRSDVLGFAGYTLDIPGRVLLDRHRRQVDLTRIEFDLLVTLACNPGAAQSREQLRRSIDGRGVGRGDRSIDMSVGRLRRKIEPDPVKPGLILTVPGIGYKFGFASHRVARPEFAIGGNGRADASSWIEMVRRHAPLPRAPEASLIAPVDDRPSIAVLPFIDISLSGADAAPFVDGLTEETTNALARIPGFFVISRHSAQLYHRAAIDVRQIAAELGVRYVLEGSVERDGSSVRANVRLISGETGRHLWAQTYNRPLFSLVEIRDEIITSIIGHLQPELIAAEMQRALEQQPVDMGAWSWLQRANGVLYISRNAENLEQASISLQRALQLAPNYAMAHALLGAVHTWRVVMMKSRDIVADHTEAREHSATALALDSENPFVLIHCAETAIYSGQELESARAMLDIAVRLAPNDPHGLALLAHARRFASFELETGPVLIKQAMRHSPRDARTYVWHHYAGWCHWQLGDLAAMEASCRRSVGLYSEAALSWLALTCALGLQGRIGEARQTAAQVTRLIRGFTPALFFETAQRFYGSRFHGKIEEDYLALRRVLESSIGPEPDSARAVVMSPRSRPRG